MITYYYIYATIYKLLQTSMYYDILYISKCLHILTYFVYLYMFLELVWGVHF